MGRDVRGPSGDPRAGTGPATSSSLPTKPRRHAECWAPGPPRKTLTLLPPVQPRRLARLHLPWLPWALRLRCLLNHILPLSSGTLINAHSSLHEQGTLHPSVSPVHSAPHQLLSNVLSSFLDPIQLGRSLLHRMGGKWVLLVKNRGNA